MNIPKKLHLTCKNKTTLDNNYIWKNCYQKYKEIYDDYEIILYDNEDIYDLINKHYPEYLDKIKQINIGAVLADIFRYLILYLEGGIYSDLDCEPLKKIDPLLMKGHTYYHGSDDNLFYIYPKNKKLTDRRHDFYLNPCDNCKFMKRSNILTFKCFGHKIETSPSTFLGYEFHKDWHSNPTPEEDNFLSEKWTYKNVGITQWFMVTEPGQEIFLKSFMKCMENIDESIALEKTDKDYHYKVLSNSANLLFAKIVVDNYTDKIKILPCDFFCAGSGLVVPVTNNSYIKHHFTNSWLPKAIGFAEEVVPPKLDHMLPSTSKSLPKNENS
jgi:mannosyltransferase OCH1-like enzyme